MNSQIFANYVTGQETVHLESCINQGKIILCNLSKGRMGEQVSTTLGRLIIAKITSIALQRASLPPYMRKPIYLVIEEADSFLRGNNSLNTILKETRKYGLHLFLCTQNIISGNQQSDLKLNVLSNTNVKIIGTNGISTLQPMSKETMIPFQQLQKLKPFSFRIHHSNQRPKHLKLKNAL